MSDKYPTASLTADIVVLSLSEEGAMKVLLIRRGGEPFKGSWALPGGFVNASNLSPRTGQFDAHGETFHEAALRELAEETGLDYRATPKMLAPVPEGVYDVPGRDPRGRVISRSFYTLLTPSEAEAAVAGDDAAELAWHDLSDFVMPDLAFDHAEILRDALRAAGLPPLRT